MSKNSKRLVLTSLIVIFGGVYIGLYLSGDRAKQSADNSLEVQQQAPSDADARIPTLTIDHLLAAPSALGATSTSGSKYGGEGQSEVPPIQPPALPQGVISRYAI